MTSGKHSEKPFAYIKISQVLEGADNSSPLTKATVLWQPMPISVLTTFIVLNIYFYYIFFSLAPLFTGQLLVISMLKK